MSAINSALATIDEIGAEGEMDANVTDQVSFDLDAVSDPIVLPDGKRIYPPLLFGEPIDAVARKLIDVHDPAASRFLRLIGPPGTGKSQVARAVAYRLWRERGNEVTSRRGNPFYGLVEMQPGPSSDEYFFRHEFVPAAERGGDVRLVDSAFVEAMREGWLVMIDEANAARAVALLSINATLDGRLALYLPATAETVVARPGFAVLLAYNPGLLHEMMLRVGERPAIAFFCSNLHEQQAAGTIQAAETAAARTHTNTYARPTSTTSPARRQSRHAPPLGARTMAAHLRTAAPGVVKGQARLRRGDSWLCRCDWPRGGRAHPHPNQHDSTSSGRQSFRSGRSRRRNRHDAAISPER
ncbi:MAG: AAA family ATPase [Solirubrobacteraceae bacterium]